MNVINHSLVAVAVSAEDKKKTTKQTSVSETIRKPPLVKAQTALKNQKKNMAKNDFQYGGWNYYTLQYGMIMTLISPGDCTLQCGMWLWNHDTEFTLQCDT